MTMDLSVQTAMAAAVENAVNTALRYDPATALALARLEGQCLAVEVSRPQATFYCLPGATGIAVQTYYDGTVTTRLRGTPPALLGLARAEHTNLAHSDVEVVGSTALLMDLQRILRELDVDWEAALSDVVGDIAGHGLAGFLRSGLNWARARKTNFERLLGEYLTEELRATPAKPELEHFYREVDEARLAADRIEAKLKLARTKLDSATASSPSPIHGS